jgi:hypothetical protein
MPATASDRHRSGFRIVAREVPAPWVAAGAVAVLGLLLIAGGGPLRPALATFGIGVLAALTLTWLHGAAARWRARRRAEIAHGAVMREGMRRLRAAQPGGSSDELLSVLAALAGAEDPGPPRSLAAATRSAVARVRADAGAREVQLMVAVDRDTRVRVAGLEPALRGLLRHAASASPPGSTVTAAICSGRVELRDAAPPADPFAADLARAIAQRAGGELHVFARADGPGTLTVLELPTQRR